MIRRLYSKTDSALEGDGARGTVSGWRESIVKFRHRIGETGKPPTVETFKAHLEWKKS